MPSSAVAAILSSFARFWRRLTRPGAGPDQLRRRGRTCSDPSSPGPVVVATDSSTTTARGRPISRSAQELIDGSGPAASSVVRAGLAGARADRGRPASRPACGDRRLAVDMECHVAAARRHGSGSSACRDPRGRRSGERTLPRSALAAPQAERHHRSETCSAALARYPRDLACAGSTACLRSRAARLAGARLSAGGPGLARGGSARAAGHGAARELQPRRRTPEDSCHLNDARGRAKHRPVAGVCARAGSRVLLLRDSALSRRGSLRLSAAGFSAALFGRLLAFSALSWVSVLCTCCSKTYCAGPLVRERDFRRHRPVGLHAEQRDLHRLERVGVVGLAASARSRNAPCSSRTSRRRRCRRSPTRWFPSAP